MLLIVWHSRTGTAQAMARAAFDGASREGPCRMLRADEAFGTAGEEALLAASGYLFCCPENLGAMSGVMKEFFDQAYYPLLGRIEGRPYATMIAAGTDGAAAQRQIDRIATGWRLRRVAEPLIVLTGAQTPEAILAAKGVAAENLLDCCNLGQGLCGGLALGVF
ncbi:flavodoxin family protein [Novosphingobium sp. SL115]|uniref:flavodoxin family protein n=1 Tax=Novosphingobium sp. SL115 TaxID=2995150 RepID=UPI002276F682|nr:NAD(P)H-dependent oxidoreductase [Novosphingobium sp. SL115]MCY1671497.1 flavodoxin family protein [Novosphingobium sp. SL115]